MRDRSTSFDDTPPNISEELKAKFAKALEGRLDLPHCRDCIQSQNFVQVIEFLIPMYVKAIDRMDIASQRMETFIAIFEQLEERNMKIRFEEDKGL